MLLHELKMEFSFGNYKIINKIWLLAWNNARIMQIYLFERK